MKERVMVAVLGGLHQAEIATYTKKFLDRLIPSGLSQYGITALEKHRSLGHMLVLLSASPEIYVRRLGEMLRFDEVICTRVEWSGERMSGKLDGPNIKGVEKVERIQKLKSRFGEAIITAYADDISDLPLLRVADKGVLVNGSPAAQKMAKKYEIEIQQWKN